jgi:hypothetical protein
LFLATAATAAARPPLTASTSVAPRPAFFGDRVTARAEIVVDDRAVDASSVRFDPDFAPYGVVGRPRRSSSSAGSVTTVGFVYTLSCLDDGCLPGASTRSISLKPARVTAHRRDGGAATLEVRWEPVLVTPRVTARAAAAGTVPWRIQLALPTVTYRAAPSTAETVAWVAAVLCAVAGTAVVCWEIVRRRRIARARARALSELARAVALVRESEDRPVDDRRRALSRLSRVLASRGNGDELLADGATRLAWDRPEPSPERIEALLRDVEERLVER